MKALEKQLAMATGAANAIERQVDMIEESALQKEVASALSASVKAAKAKGKGVLNAAEVAVDGAAEVRDMAEDLQQVMEGLSLQDGGDEDDLLAELETMDTVPEAASEDASLFANPTTATANHMEEENSAFHESDVLASHAQALSFPQAPQSEIRPKKEERMQLLASS